MFKITIEKNNTLFDWYYSTSKNIFYNSNNEQIEVNYNLDSNCNDVINNDILIRITLGMQCNYNCKYCSENYNKHRIIEKCKDYDKFVDSLYDFLNTHVDINSYDCFCFSFWGGEPLLYFNEIQELTPRLNKKFKKCRFSFSTNGELLDFEKYKFIEKYDFIVGVSYDGPGQFVRHSKDIFENNSIQYKVVQKILDNRFEKFLFQPVFHKYNYSIIDYIEFLQNKFKRKNFLIGELALLRVYDEQSKAYSLNEEQLKQLSQEISYVALNHDKYFCMRKYYGNCIHGFCNTYGNPRCFKEDKTHTACFVGNDYFSIDLNGNLWTCHNNTGQEQDEYGNALKLGNIYTNQYKKPKFINLKHRQLTKCKSCLLANICLGGCPMTDSKYDDINCLTYQYRRYPIFNIVLNFLTDGGNIVAIKKIMEMPNDN